MDLLAHQAKGLVFPSKSGFKTWQVSTVVFEQIQKLITEVERGR